MRSLLLSSIAVGAMALAGLAYAQSAGKCRREPAEADRHAGDRNAVAAFQPVPQNDDYAAQLRKNLERSSCPTASRSSFSRWCRTPATWRSGRKASSTFVGTRKEAVWAITDRNKDGIADEVKRFAPSIQFAIPNGVCFSRTAFSSSPSRTGC